MNRIQRDTLLGIVFFGTLAFLLWATVNLTDMSLGKVAPIKVMFRDVGGIRLGDPVLLLGKRIGKVTEIDFLGQRTDAFRMRLTMRVEAELPLTLQYRIEIQASGVLGGKQVYVDPGIGDPWPADRELVGIAAADPLASAGGFFSGEGPSGKELNELLRAAKTFFVNINDPDTTIGAIVRRRELYDEVLGSVQSLRRIFQSIEDGEGLVGRFIKDPNLRDDGLRIVANLARVTERLNGTDSALGRLLNDRQMSEQLAQIALNFDAIVQRINDGRGVFGRMVNDEQMSNNLADAVAALASVLRKADDPEAGAFGALAADKQLRGDLVQIVANLRSISDKLDTGKGLLGVLISDEDLAARFRRILTQVSRALEDAREAAPIGNFIQVLLGTF